MSNPQAPRVSVIMGVFNCSETIDDAIQSLVSQTYQNWDLVVCDDASSDATYQRLLEWQQRLPGRMLVLRNNTNAQLAHSLNRCLEHATGDFIARMDGDDISLPQRFTQQVAYLLAHPDVDLIGTAMQRFNQSGLADVVTMIEKPDKYALRSGTPFCHATVMARRSVFESLDGYTDLPRTVRAEDLDLWFRFFAQGRVGHNLSEPLYHVREDLDAIRRRDLANRIAVFKTTILGYSTLKFPLYWYVMPVLQLLKALVPSKAIVLYRRLQNWLYQRATAA